MRWLLPALTPQELTAMLRGLVAMPGERAVMISRVASEVLPSERLALVEGLFPVHSAEAA